MRFFAFFALPINLGFFKKTRFRQFFTNPRAYLGPSVEDPPGPFQYFYKKNHFFFGRPRDGITFHFLENAQNWKKISVKSVRIRRNPKMPEIDEIAIFQKSQKCQKCPKFVKMSKISKSRKSQISSKIRQNFKIRRCQKSSNSQNIQKFTKSQNSRIPKSQSIKNRRNL